MDRWLENLTKGVEWISLRSGRPLFLIGVSFFLLGLAGWMVMVLRKRTGRRQERSSATHPKSLAEQILDLSGHPCVVLMASERYDCLSVTVPVQTAMELVRRKKRCLLIDLDLARNAVARVFELESLPSLDRPRPIQTPFKDLHVWPAEYFDGDGSIPLSKVVAAATGAYDVVLLYGPVLQKSPHLQAAASACQCAFIFHPAGDFSEGLRLNLQRGGAVLRDFPTEVSPAAPPPHSPSEPKQKRVEYGPARRNGTANQDLTAVVDVDNKT